jgi:hypothetical protein
MSLISEDRVLPSFSAKDDNSYVSTTFSPASITVVKSKATMAQLAADEVPSISRLRHC